MPLIHNKILRPLALAASLLSIHTALQAADITVYEDALASGWNDWSWNTTSSVNTTRVKSGTSSLAVKYQSGWAGLSWQRSTPMSTAAYTALHFWVYPTASTTLRVGLQTSDTVDPQQTYTLTPTVNTWTEVNIPLTALGNPAQIARINIQEGAGAKPATFYLDQVSLSGPTVQTRLTVDANRSRHAISPYIYGMNSYGADTNTSALWDELKLPVARFGGNNTSRYNWKLDASNTAMDWYYENVRLSDATNLPADSAVNRFIEQNRTAGTQSLVTTPMMGYVAKNSLSCSFSVKKYGAQTGGDWQWRPDCGNGIKTNGQAVTGNNPADTSVAAPPTFVRGWVNYLKQHYGTANKTGVRFYALDNEADLWHETHRDIFPVGLTYDQLRDRTYQYAAAIKAADAQAKILGPVFTLWPALWMSPNDVQRGDYATPDDRNAHGGVPLIPWYLQQMRAYEQSNGKRILDYLDLHYYPAEAGVSLAPAGDAATQALRLRSTRSLWDASYVDESWIANSGIEGGVIRFIPLMREWVKANYPNTKLAISEYNWGGFEHINGALAEADVLGIFGREGLDLATLWGVPKVTDPVTFAFRLFRNYDGNGGQFGTTSVFASSTQQDDLAVYAAEEPSGLALTVMVINKSKAAITAPVTLRHFIPNGTAQAWRYSEANLQGIQPLSNQAVTPTGWKASFPAESISLYRIQGRH
jgi:hypothetical protein